MKSLFFALLAIASRCADSFGQTVINSVPYTISTPDTYILGSDLVYPSATGQAISIAISNVTLDLAGHRLYHPPGTQTDPNVGISVPYVQNVTIQNGIIEGFAIGVYFNYTGVTTINSGNIVQNLRLTNIYSGIVLNGATNSRVTNNQITNAARNGGGGIDLSGGGNVAGENIISGFFFGIFASGNNYLFENTIYSCNTGLEMAPSDKYRFNTTFDCGTPFVGGIALASDNN